MTAEREVNFNRPAVTTKQIKFNTVAGKRKGRLSSNWVVLYGFNEDSRVVERSLGRNKGIEVRLASDSEIQQGRTKKVYTRLYKSRQSSPMNPVARRKERVIEFSSQRLIDYSFPENCTHMHIEFRYGVIRFTPATKKQFNNLQELSSSSEAINTAVMFSGGVDAHLLAKDGFRNVLHIESRPNAKRDKSDYTELTSLTTIVNSSPSVLVNEDVHTIDMAKMASLVEGVPITCLHASIPCTDFSQAKSKKAKQKSVEDMSSSIDCFIPVLNALDALKSPVLIVENVPSFCTGQIFDVFTMQLKRRGFKIHYSVMDARDYEGFTSRKRMYLVATQLDSEFSMPKPTFCRTDVWQQCVEPFWDEISQMDVTDTKVIQDAIKTGWNRPITQTKGYAPTILASQGQLPKDRVTIEKEGRVYNPPLSVLRALNSIPESFDIDWCPADKATQVIGSSICCKLHSAVMKSVRKHILAATRIGNKSFSSSMHGLLAA